MQDMGAVVSGGIPGTANEPPRPFAQSGIGLLENGYSGRRLDTPMQGSLFSKKKCRALSLFGNRCLDPFGISKHSTKPF
jgi:hypothetical protein